MDYKVFYRKYRPDNFKDIISQDATKIMLQNAIKNNRIAHAYIFTGPRGTGKTTTAKVFAKAINCENPLNGEACNVCVSCTNFSINSDIIEIDAASNNGVEEARELINNIKISPANSKYKIYIIDEVHMMTQSAFNALLLTLEEPPSHVVFILATTNIESVPITILSRCQRFDFRKFCIQDLVNQIKYVCEHENVEISEDAAEEIAYVSEGGMRDALSLLDQLSSNSKSITIDSILLNYGSISSVFIKKLIQNLLSNDILSLNKQMEELKSGSTDYKIFIKKFIQELVNLAIRLKCDNYQMRLTYEQIKCLIFELNDCMNRTNININPYVLIEITLLSYVENITNSKVLEKEIIVEHSNDAELEKKLVDIKEQPISNILVEEIVLDNSNNINIEKMKQILINNCFFAAKKDVLNDLKRMWTELKDSPIPDDVLSLLIDTNIVVSSNTIAIISSALPSTSILINNRIQEITDYLCEFFDKEMKFIALFDDEWNKEKKVYVENIKNGFKYEVIPEIEFSKKEIIDENQPIEKTAQDLFDSDKIEIV